MKKKIFFVALFAATLLCADLVVGATSKLIIRHAPQTQYNLSNTIQTLFHRTSDVLILGASRAHHSFDPRIIQRETGLSCFNGGRSGVKMGTSSETARTLTRILRNESITPFGEPVVPEV